MKQSRRADWTIVFLEQLRKTAGHRGPVAWIRREENDQKDDAYYKKAIGKAVLAYKTLVWRRGGGAALGILGMDGGPETHAYRFMGSPKWWGPSCVRQFVEHMDGRNSEKEHSRHREFATND